MFALLAGAWADVPHETLTRLRTLLIVSDARANQSAADLRIARSETMSLSHKLRYEVQVLGA